MIFDLAHIDNGIELKVRSVVEGLDYWPNQTQFFLDDDASGFESSLEAMIANNSTLIKVFGPGSYSDRENVVENNIVISRTNVGEGDIGFSSPTDYEEYDDNGVIKYRRVKTEEGTKNIEYEVRYITKKNNIDQILNDIILKSFSSRKFIYGYNITESPNLITKTEEGFWIFRNGDPVDVSGGNYIERIYRFRVVDICLEETEILYDGIVQATKFTVGLSPEEGEEI